MFYPFEFQVPEYVNAICDIPGVDNVVESWHVIDEPVANPRPPEWNLTPATVQSVVSAFHQAQQARGKNWPFIIVEAGDGPPETPQNPDGWWPRVDTDGDGVNDDRTYQPDECMIYQYVNAIVNAGGTPIFAIDYYPWAANQWPFGALPPWRKWRFFITKYRQMFPNYQIHAVLEGGAQANERFPFAKRRVPGHVDMHQQVRMARNYGFDAIWFWGWGNVNYEEEEKDRKLRYTMLHWVYSDSGNPNQGDFVRADQAERWGEAVANEVTAQVEGVSDVIPPGSGMLDPLEEKVNEEVKGFWIKYDLSTRWPIKFEIYWNDCALVRIIDSGYKDSTAKPIPGNLGGTVFPSVPGRYYNIPSDNVLEEDSRTAGDLGGTAAFWNKKNYNFQEVPDGSYTIRMYRFDASTSAWVEIPPRKTVTIP